MKSQRTIKIALRKMIFFFPRIKRLRTGGGGIRRIAEKRAEAEVLSYKDVAKINSSSSTEHNADGK